MITMPMATKIIQQGRRRITTGSVIALTRLPRAAWQPFPGEAR